jgi:hypothetical protein
MSRTVPLQLADARHILLLRHKKMVSKRVFLICILYAVYISCLAWPAQAQNDYPLPAGPPDTWDRGRTERLTTEKGPATSPFSAPPLRGNLAQEQPQAPAGDAEEFFTGTRTQVAPDTSKGMPSNPVPGATPMAAPEFHR